MNFLKKDRNNRVKYGNVSYTVTNHQGVISLNNLDALKQWPSDLGFIACYKWIQMDLGSQSRKYKSIPTVLCSALVKEQVTFMYFFSRTCILCRNRKTQQNVRVKTYRKYDHKQKYDWRRCYQNIIQNRQRAAINRL